MNDVMRRVQYVLTRHSVEKTDEVIIPLYFFVGAGCCPVIMEPFPQLWHAWAVGIQSFGNKSQYDGCHLQQFAAQGLGIRGDRSSLSELFLSLQEDCALWQRCGGGKSSRSTVWRGWLGFDPASVSAKNSGVPSRLLNTERSSHVAQGPRRKTEDSMVGMMVFTVQDQVCMQCRLGPSVASPSSIRECAPAFLHAVAIVLHKTLEI